MDNTSHEACQVVPRNVFFKMSIDGVTLIKHAMISMLFCCWYFAFVFLLIKKVCN